MRPHRRRVIVALLGSALLAGCGGGDEGAQDQETAVESEVEASAEPSPEVPVASSDAGADDEGAGDDGEVAEETVTQDGEVLSSDAEPDLQHDIGTIEELVIDAEGATWIRFNRWQRYQDGASGSDFTEPPSNAGATDVQFVDENPALRAYPVSARVSVGEISNHDSLCAMETHEPEYTETDLATFVEQHPDAVVALSFDEFGEVFVVSDERSC